MIRHRHRRCYSARVKDLNVLVGGLICNYRHEGAGPAVLLIHGWAQSAATWNAVIPELAKTYSVYAIDLPGFGESQTPAQPWNVDEYAGFVGAFTAALNIKPYAVLGHSFGARVAALYAAQHSPPRLVLYGMGSGRRSFFRLLNILLMHTVGRIAPRLLYAAHRSLLTPAGYTDDSELTSARARMMLRIYANTHGTESPPSLRCPTLLIYGKRDPITPYWIGSRLSGVIPGSKLVTLPQEGHLAHIRNPQIFLQHILTFLRD